jgi:hypothetical protein
LVCQTGAHAGKHLAVTADKPLTFKLRKNNQDAGAVSVELRDGQTLFTNRSSLPSQVNGQERNRAVLHAGDRVLIGKDTFVVEEDADTFDTQAIVPLDLLDLEAPTSTKAKSTGPLDGLVEVPAKVGPIPSAAPVKIGATPSIVPVKVGSTPTMPPVKVGNTPTIQPVKIGSTPGIVPVKVGNTPTIQPVKIGATPTIQPVKIGSTPSIVPVRIGNTPSSAPISLAGAKPPAKPEAPPTKMKPVIISAIDPDDVEEEAPAAEDDDDLIIPTGNRSTADTVVPSRPTPSAGAIDTVVPVRPTPISSAADTVVPTRTPPKPAAPPSRPGSSGPLPPPAPAPRPAAPPPPPPPQIAGGDLMGTSPALVRKTPREPDPPPPPARFPTPTPPPPARFPTPAPPSPRTPTPSPDDRHAKRISASRLSVVEPAPPDDRGLFQRVSGLLGGGRAERQRLEQLEAERQQLLIESGRLSLGAGGGLGLPETAIAALVAGKSVTLGPDEISANILEKWRSQRDRARLIDGEIAAVRRALGLSQDSSPVLMPPPVLRPERKALEERAFHSLDGVSTQDLGEGIDVDEEPPPPPASSSRQMAAAPAKAKAKPSATSGRRPPRRR